MVGFILPQNRRKPSPSVASAGTRSANFLCRAVADGCAGERYGDCDAPKNLCATFCTPYDYKGKVALSSQSGGIGMAIMV